MNIIPLDEAHLDEAISFVTRLNRDKEHNISYIGDHEKEIAADFTAIQPPEGYGYLAYSDNQQLIGFLGVELDPELGRCWLLGPLVENGTWESVADALYSGVLSAIPETIDDQELFFDADNVNLDRFAARHGFTFYSGAVILALGKSNYKRPSHADDPGFDDNFTIQFIDLHSGLFPGTYYSAEQLIEKAGDQDKRLLIHVTDGKLTGYIFIQAREASRDGFIDFIGVDEGFRRQGIGKHLLTSGLNWVFSLPQVEKATLTVKTSNKPALRLYDSMDFKTERITKAYRKRGEI
jgi:ribosomal protein S18 acetylase RimI-like enzyme